MGDLPALGLRMLVPFPSCGAFVISGFSGAFGQNFKCSQVLEEQIFCPNGFAVNVGDLFVWVFIFALAQNHFSAVAEDVIQPCFDL